MIKRSPQRTISVCVYECTCLLKWEEVMLYVGFVTLLLALAKTFHLYVKCYFLSNFIENVVLFFAVFLVTNRLSNCFVSRMCYWFVVVREGRNGNKERRKKKYFFVLLVLRTNFEFLKLWLGVATWMMILNHRHANI